MRDFVSIILEAGTRRAWRCFLWGALLWGSGCGVLAQERAVFAGANEVNATGRSLDAARGEEAEVAGVTRALAIKHLEQTFQSQDYAAAVEEARSFISGVAEGSPDLDMAIFVVHILNFTPITQIQYPSHKK